MLKPRVTNALTRLLLFKTEKNKMKHSNTAIVTSVSIFFCWHCNVKIGIFLQLSLLIIKNDMKGRRGYFYIRYFTFLLLIIKQYFIS